MPFAYPHRAHLKVEILARVAAGETVAGICSQPGMPSADTVKVWRGADAQFAADLAAARRRKDWARRFAFDEAVAAAFLARVAAGEAVNSLLGQPGMPRRATYDYWRRTQMAFQERLGELRGARYARRSASGHGRWRAWDEATADRLLLAVMRGAPLRRLLASDPALPSLAVLARWRREEPDWGRALRVAMKAGRRAAAEARGRARLEPLRDAIGDRIVTGGSLRSLGAEPDMPCAATLYGWFRRWPDFAREVGFACDLREEWLNLQMIEICERNGPLGLAATKREAAPLQRAANRLARRPGRSRRDPTR